MWYIDISRIMAEKVAASFRRLFYNSQVYKFMILNDILWYSIIEVKMNDGNFVYESINDRLNRLKV